MIKIYLTSETDPVFAAWLLATPPLYSFTETDPIFTAWLLATPPLYSFTETDPVFAAHQAANITVTDITNLGNLSGENTGDQDLSGYLTFETDPVFAAWLLATPPLYSFTETDPVFVAHQAANITATDITNLGNLSGENTGDQDLSSYWERDGSSTAAGNWDIGAYDFAATDGDFSGDLVVGGETLFSDKIKFTQTDSNEYIDSLASGYMDYGATTGHRFNRAVTVTGNISASNLSGTNTGDQDLSGYLLNTTDQFDGDLIIDGSSVEALLVRKDSDGGDVFTVDTTNSKIIVGGVSHQIGYTGEEDMIVLSSINVTVNNDLFADNLSGTNTGDQALSGLVPYTGATDDVDLGANDLTVGGDLEVAGSIKSSGGRIVNTSRVTTTYTILVSDHRVFCNTDGGDFTVTLPEGIDGQEYRIINTGSGTLTVAPNSAELIDGVNASKTMGTGIIILTYETTEGWW